MACFSDRGEENRNIIYQTLATSLPTHSYLHVFSLSLIISLLKDAMAFFTKRDTVTLFTSNNLLSWHQL